jgi:methyl-accepting chemotaxis protein
MASMLRGTMGKTSLRVTARLGLVPRIMVLAVSGVVLLGAAVTATTVTVIRQDAARAARERIETNIRVAWQELRRAGQPFRLADGMLLAGDHVLNGNFEVVDRVKDLVGGTATVFMGDTRVSTNVLKSDGSRAIGTQLARTAAYEAVFTRKEGFRGEVGILGEPYMTAYDPILDPEGTVVGVLYVGIKKAEFLGAADRTVWTVVGATGLAALLASAASYLIARRTIAVPLKAGISAMRALAGGNLEVAVPASAREDEIGEMAQALAVFKAAAVDRRALAEAQRRSDQARERRQAAVEQLTSDFSLSVQGILGGVTTSADSLRDSAGSMIAVARETSTQSSAAAAAAEQASANVETVAAAAEELAASEAEIARQINRSSEIVRTAADEAGRVDAVVRTLAEATDRIGEVVTLINDIASQTNLLALNATIEAARAGEAGKGFAVVAGEVKNLAAQTARATDEIAHQIDSVRSVAAEVVTAIAGIGRTITTLNDGSATIAHAVEEQSAATQEIARNVQEASAGTREVTGSMAQINEEASATGTTAHAVYDTAESLSRQSKELTTEISDFLQAMKAAGDRREYERVATRLPATLHLGQLTRQVTVVDVSLGGARIDVAVDASTGTAVELRVDGWPPVRARVVGHGDAHTGLQFALDPATQARLRDVLPKAAA